MITMFSSVISKFCDLRFCCVGTSCAEDLRASSNESSPRLAGKAPPTFPDCVPLAVKANHLSRDSVLPHLETQQFSLFVRVVGKCPRELHRRCASRPPGEASSTVVSLGPLNPGAPRMTPWRRRGLGACFVLLKNRMPRLTLLAGRGGISHVEGNFSQGVTLPG